LNLSFFPRPTRERQSEIARRQVEIGKRFQLGEFAKQAKEPTAAPDPFQLLQTRTQLAIATGDTAMMKDCLAKLDALAGE